MRERGYDGEQGVGRGTKERRPIDLVNLHREKKREREADGEMCPSRPLRALFIWRSRVTKKKLYPILPTPPLSSLAVSLSLYRRGNGPGGKLRLASTWTGASATLNVSNARRPSSAGGKTEG